MWRSYLGYNRETPFFMTTKRLVLICWLQVAVATVLVALNFTSNITRPWCGFDYSRSTAAVSDVVSGSPAEKAGLRPGDAIVTLNGHAIAPEANPLFFTKAGEPVRIVVRRGGALETLTVTPVSQEAMRREGLHGGTLAALASINSYLSFPLHLWMLGLAVALLLLRPENKDARIASLCVAYWAGGMFMFRLPGFGSILRTLSPAMQTLLLTVDAFYIAGFFALCVHFATVFPSERIRAGRAVQWLPYAAVVPVFVEAVAHGLRRVHGDIGPAVLPWRDAYSTIGAAMLLGALGILAVRFTLMRDPNPRRRLQLIFLSMLPGTLTFVLGYVLTLLPFDYEWQVRVRLLHTPAMILGSGLFGYAVVRHRLFNIRVLVRRSLQYALARSTLLALMAMPVVGLAIFLYANRSQSLSVLLTGTPAIYALLIVPLVVVIRYRKRLLESLDRRFFREQYDAKRLLLHVVSMIRGGSDLLVLSRAAIDEIDRALHPKHLSLWQLDTEGATLQRGFARGLSSEGEPLPADATLCTLLSTDDEPLDVHSRQTRSLLQRLPEADRRWLRAVDAYLLVPLLIDERLAGVMVLGERKSEEPYSGEDREMLRMLGAQLALTLDYSRLKHSPSLVWSASTASAPVQVHGADIVQLCPKCGRCYPADAQKCEADDKPLVPESGVPRIIEDKYVITRLVGRGGMGSVYQATQTRLNRPVAIKVLLAHLVGSATMRSRFEREARIVARLRHPAIVTIHDFGVLSSGHAYLVMEYLDGDTLRKRIASGPQPFERVVELLRAVGEAIDAAHHAGIVHRDLKPENIMIVKAHGNEESPRVLDFGLAKMSGTIGDDEATLLQSHSAGVVGTLMYMAPEVLSGHGADARADQYSLGLIAYELLAGEHPLGRSTDLASVVRGHTELPMISIRERANVPRGVADAIDRALAKKPEQRFATVGEFVERLVV